MFFFISWLPDNSRHKTSFKTIYLHRVLGGLLSAHLLIMDKSKPFGNIEPANYEGELLSLANDLASRLVPAFDNTATGIPFPRVSSINNVNDILFRFFLAHFCAF